MVRIYVDWNANDLLQWVEAHPEKDWQVVDSFNPWAVAQDLAKSEAVLSNVVVRLKLNETLRVKLFSARRRFQSRPAKISSENIWT